MTKAIHRWGASTAVFALVAGMAMAACGGSGHDPGSASVVEVNGVGITQAAVDHWMSVVAAGESTATGQPKPATPQPPAYVGCISYSKRYRDQTASRAQLKSACEFEYQKEKLKALYIVITNDWVSGEAAELGVQLLKSQLNDAMASLEGQSFPGGVSFRRYLADSGLTVSDMTSQIRSSLLISKVQQKLEAQHGASRLPIVQRQQLLAEFGREYERKWKLRTDCRAGYVVPICRQYRAPKTPPVLVPPSVPLTNLAAG